MTPMERDSRKATEEEGFAWGPDTIEAEIRVRIRGMIEAIVEEELETTLGAGRSQRVGAVRVGYRHGARERQLTTSLGKTTITLPRAPERRRGRGKRMAQPDYSALSAAHRARGRGAARAYLSGINSRRLRGALSPLLRGAPLSKDAVSRLVGRLRDEFTVWSTRDLAAEEVCYLFLDGWYPRVRIGQKRVRVPVLVVLGVCADGRRIVLAMRIAGQESAAAWRELLEALVERHLATPSLAVIDGNPGLLAALRAQWPELAIQRCTNHKLRNLLAKAPAHLREELAEDFRRMVYADRREAVEEERARFVRKWRLRCKAVVSSFEEAGDELFTFLEFSQSQWKALRTTNALERINEEFRRRTKTQASLPDEDAVLLLLYGLLRSGQIVLRRIDGRNDLPKPKAQLKAA
jgi:transposase-like protein